MFNQTLTYSVSDRPKVNSVSDQIQVALAIADETILKSLLVDSVPSISAPHRIGTVHSSVGVPIETHEVADGVLQFESISCILASSQSEVEQAIAANSYATGAHTRRNEYAKLTQCESETRVLGQNISLAQALGILSHAGFMPHQVQEILYLPNEAWHKTWWYALDDFGDFTVPFRRLIRTRRFADGTFTIQYKDYFAQDKPPCFKGKTQNVLIDVALGDLSFSYRLRKINYLRQHLGIEKAILICDYLSDLEAQGFISQGISIYSVEDVMLPTQSDCGLCVNRECPMNGRRDSPVLTCRRFCLEDWHD